MAATSGGIFIRESIRGGYGLLSIEAEDLSAIPPAAIPKASKAIASRNFVTGIRTPVVKKESRTDATGRLEGRKGKLMLHGDEAAG
jgi:hypothetical protein